MNFSVNDGLTVDFIDSPMQNGALTSLTLIRPIPQSWLTNNNLSQEFGHALNI